MEGVKAQRLSVSPNEFEGSDIERINQAVKVACVEGCRVVIPKVNKGADAISRELWLIDSAILLPSGCTLEFDNCHIKLSDKCRDNFIRSSNCGIGIEDIKPLRDIHIRGIGSAVLEGADHPRATGDSAKTIGQQTYGTDAGKPDESQSGDWRNIGILLAYVEDFSIENVRVVNPHCWSISLERCAFGKVRDIIFDSTGGREIDGVKHRCLNQDGIDLRQGCHDIDIEGIRGRTGDDIVALTNIVGRRPTVQGTMVSRSHNRGGGIDDIHNVTIRNVSGSTAHHLVRLLNACGLRIYDIVIDGVVEYMDSPVQPHAGVKIGDSNPAWGGPTPPGDTFRISVSNVFTKAKGAIFIAGAISDSNISNVISYGSEAKALNCQVPESYIKDVVFSNVREAGPQS